MKNIFDVENRYGEPLTVLDYGSVLCLAPSLRCYLSEYSDGNSLIAHRTKAGYPSYNYVNPSYSPTPRFGSETVRMFTSQGIDDDIDYTVLDIETTGLDPHKDKIEQVGFLFHHSNLSDNETNDYVVLLDGEEEVILPIAVELLSMVSGLLVGHNISAFDLDFIKTRYQRLINIQTVYAETECGEIDSTEDSYFQFPFHSKTRQFRVGMETKQIKVWNSFTAQTIDTYPLSERLDNMMGSRVGGYGLKQLVYEWRLTDKKRTEKYMQTEDKVSYLVDDLVDTESLFLFVTDWFRELMHFGALTWNNVYDGTGSLVNKILFTWLSFIQPIPKYSETEETYTGGFVDLLNSGFYTNVFGIDVVSMYPNIMKRHIKPYWDIYGFFPAIVSVLLEKRLHLKKSGFESKQKALKILINSMYGFLASGVNYSDTESAKKVTEIGRKTIQNMQNIIESSGGIVLELDTDGIYFAINPSTATPTAEDIQRRIEEETGFKTELNKYDAGLFVKKKNYALWKDGELILKGNSLRSRRDNAIYKRLVIGIVNAYYNSYKNNTDAKDEIQKLWDTAWHEYINYDLKTLPKAWYSGDELPVSPPKTIAERLDRLEKLRNVFLRFESLPEISKLFENERRSVWRKRLDAERQQTISFT